MLCDDLFPCGINSSLITDIDIHVLDRLHASLLLQLVHGRLSQLGLHVYYYQLDILMVGCEFLRQEFAKALRATSQQNDCTLGHGLLTQREESIVQQHHYDEGVPGVFTDQMEYHIINKSYIYYILE